jgi:hypothetical protein
MPSASFPHWVSVHVIMTGVECYTWKWVGTAQSAQLFSELSELLNIWTLKASFHHFLCIGCLHIFYSLLKILEFVKVIFNVELGDIAIVILNVHLPWGFPSLWICWSLYSWTKTTVWSVFLWNVVLLSSVFQCFPSFWLFFFCMNLSCLTLYKVLAFLLRL